MENTIKNNFYIITGGTGSGKSTLLNALEERGFTCVPEAAREIIQEQTRLGGDALHTKDQIKFRDMMLAESIRVYLEMTESSRPVFFDRGIPDLAGYCRLIKSTVTDEIHKAISAYRYNPLVFVTPPWEEIYQHDTERKQDWEEAAATYHHICRGYIENSYSLIELPKCSIEERVEFILDKIDKEISS